MKILTMLYVKRRYVRRIRVDVDAMNEKDARRTRTAADKHASAVLPPGREPYFSGFAMITPERPVYHYFFFSAPNKPSNGVLFGIFFRSHFSPYRYGFVSAKGIFSL